MVRRCFLQDVDPSTSDEAVSRLARRSLVAFTQPPRQIARRAKPACYVVCAEDLATPAQVQRERVRGTARAVEFAAGHHPFLSRPDAFAGRIATEIRAVV